MTADVEFRAPARGWNFIGRWNWLITRGAMRAAFDIDIPIETFLWIVRAHVYDAVPVT